MTIGVNGKDNNCIKQQRKDYEYGFKHIPIVGQHQDLCQEGRQGRGKARAAALLCDEGRGHASGGEADSRVGFGLPRVAHRLDFGQETPHIRQA